MTRAIQIEGGRVLVNGALEEASLTLQSGTISAIGGPRPRGALVLDAGQLLVLPGLVDVHSDAFERQIMPRPGVHFDIEMALRDTDCQLASNGITTCYHGLTLSWEPGLRSLDAGRQFMTALARARATLGCDHRVQIRWETFLLDAAMQVAEWLRGEPQPVLAFNDHTTSTARKLSDGTHKKLNEWAARAGLSAKDYVSLFNDVWRRRGEVPAAIEKLAAHARKSGAVMLSHDDQLKAERLHYRALGADVCEFPMTREVVEEARDADEHTVLGAPNVVRGGSHTGALAAASMVDEGLCTILASDYYCPALPAAAARLIAEQNCGISDVWDLVSRAPAEAMRLTDRGRIEIGLRGDVVLARLDQMKRLHIEVTLANGRIVFINGHERIAA